MDNTRFRDSSRTHPGLHPRQDFGWVLYLAIFVLGVGCVGLTLRALNIM